MSAYASGGAGEDKNFDRRLEDLEAALAAEREKHSLLAAQMERESFERTESLLWQEHRILAALRSVYNYRKHSDLRHAAIGGLISALVGRATSAAALGGGFIALSLTVLLTLHANHLLSVQNEKMDVQTIVMDAQRRTQSFQVEFLAVSAEVSEQVSRAAAQKKMVEEAVLASLGRSARAIQVVLLSSPSFRMTGPEASQRMRAEELAAQLSSAKVGNDIYMLAASVLALAESPLWADVDLSALKESADALDRDLEAYVNARALWQPVEDGYRFRLDESTVSRIVALTRSVQPYPALSAVVRARSSNGQGLFDWIRRYLFGGNLSRNEVDATLVPQVVSFERGVLLTFLAKQRVYLPELSGADFSYADLSNRKLEGAILMDVSHADFKRTTFIDVTFAGDISGANFSCATFVKARFKQIPSSGASFARADLRAIFGHASEMPLSILSEADFADANLDGLVLAIENEQVPDLLETPTLGTLLKVHHPTMRIRPDTIMSARLSQGADGRIALSSSLPEGTNYGEKCVR